MIDRPTADRLDARLAEVADLEVRPDAPLAALTTYRIGGPARWLLVPHTHAALGAALGALEGAGVPWLVLGNGSNVLVSDRGFAGAVVKLGRGFAGVELARDHGGPGRHRLEAGGALSITRLLRFAKAERLAGLEPLGGVPATVGGAVRMNAGTRLGELKDALLAAELVTPGAAPAWHPADALGLAYRRSALPPGAVVTAARFAVGDATEAMIARLDEVLAYRKATQPLQQPSCGSVFANPPGDAAGRLIEAAGLKGRRIGGAEVSEQHANWIVNVGGATAADVAGLIALCADEVEARFGVRLRPEVQRVGDWQDAAEPAEQPAAEGSPEVRS